jgi:LysM repeat protein
MEFQDLQRRYEQLREQFDAGEIGEDEFRQELESLQFRDEQGRYWTIGAQTGEWYRYDGRTWIQETPLPLTKHEGRGMPEYTSPEAAERAASPLPRWIYTGCGGLLVLVVVAGLIVGAASLLRGRGDALSQVATPTLSSGLPANTPTLGPTPSPTPTVEITDTPVTPKVYSNSAYGFSLQYPGNWQVKEGSQQVVVAPDARGLATTFDADDLSPQGAAFVVEYQAESVRSDPAGLLGQAVAGLPADASTLETGYRTVEQVEWAISQVEFPGADADENMTAYVAATFQNGSAYRVLAAAPSGDWAAFAPVFQQMFDSFEFSQTSVAAIITPGRSRTATLTATATATPTATTAEADITPTPIVHVIESGETLGALAIRYDVSVEELQAVNDITDPALLRIGQEILIPVGGVVPERARAATPTSEAESIAAVPAATATPEESGASGEEEAAPTLAPTPAPVAAAANLGGKIIYPVFNPNKVVQDQVGAYDIWMSDPQGNNRQVLLGDASQPHLNLGGDLLAYRNWNPVGRGVAFLTLGGGRGDLLTGFLEDGLPSWSPDSITMAFASRREGDRVPRIFRVNQVTGEEYSLGLIGEYVSTFPDGRLVFKGCTVEGACGMFIAGPEGGAASMISNVTSDTAPTPSPNGAQIAFMSYDRDGAGNWEIFMMDTSGGSVRRLTSNSANDGLPAWSPDGNTLAFASDRDGAWAIWAMSPDGGNQRKLFDMGGSPDGIIGFDINNSKGWLEERITWGP